MSRSPLTVADLERWELSGAQWRVVQVSEEQVVLDLCACTGEVVERRESSDGQVIRYVRSARGEAD
jgi:hypothetical protein